MILYFSPMTCSLATRMALCEAGLDAQVEFLRVDLATRALPDGSPYSAVAPKGGVAALRTREGYLLTENAAILQYVGDLAPAGELTPAAGSLARYQLQEWLSYIGTELHKHVFYAIFNPFSPPEARDYAREQAAPVRLSFVEQHLQGRDFLVGEHFTVADAYLTTVLNWTERAGLDLSLWPNLKAYWRRQNERPAVRRAVAEEMALLAA